MQPETLSRRRINRTRRHLLIYSLYRHGEVVFNRLSAFQSWLERPNTALNNDRPIDQLITANGFKKVDDLLTRIEFGVY